MKALLSLGYSLAASVVVISFAFAQSPAGGPPQPAGLEKQQVYTRDTIAPEDLRKLADFMDKESIIERKDLVSTYVARGRVSKVFALLKIDCKIVNVAHVAEATGKQWGWTNVAVGLYEAACENGMGYLVTLRDTHEASATSCFAAESQINESSKATRAEHCLLPENVDPNTRAQKMLSTLGVSCTVDASQWLGQSTTLHLDYIESRCKEGQGYVIHVPIPGSRGAAGTISCEQSAQAGIPCKLTQRIQSASTNSTAASDSRPTLQWFKDALAKNNVSCDTKQARLVGREKIKKRHIVEFQCDQKPQGLVVYVPADGDATNLFESIDCAAAATRGISCQFGMKAPGN